jgi:hypothetical protein
MGNVIIINKNIIELQAKSHGYHNDTSWTLDMDDIKIIGAVSRMAGDDDSFFIILVDHKMKLYIVNTTYLEDGRAALFTLLESKFEIDILHWERSIEDEDVVLYPQEHKGKKLYKFNLLHFIKRITGFVNIASGSLSSL